MSNKAQLGRILTIFPVMLLIFIVLGIYLFTAGFAFLIKQPSIPADIENVEFGNILQKTITINGEETTVLNALIRFRDKKIDRPILETELKKLVDKDNNLLLLTVGKEGVNNFMIKYENNNIYGNSDEILAEYRTKGLLKEISLTIKNAKTYIEYYYGAQQ